MTWYLQITLWALPPLLGVLVVLRDLEYLWPRRREQGAAALMAAALTSGLWAFLALISVISPSLQVKVILEWAEYAVGALAPLAWVAFAFTYTRRRRELWGVPCLILCLPTLVTLILAFRVGATGLLVRDYSAVDIQGTIGLLVTHGWWHWVHVAVRALAVVGAALILANHQVRTRHRGAVFWVVLAVVLALAPAVFQLSAIPGAAWADQTPAGFAVGTAVLGLGLARRRFLDFGPVARTLVMDDLPDPIVVLDGRGRIVDVNRAAERELGLRTYGALPVELGTLWASSPPEGRISRRMDLEVASGEVRAFNVAVSRMGKRRATGHAALLLVDVTERERMHQDLEEKREQLESANAELKRLAQTDALTGLANRRHFIERLEREVERAHRYDRPLSLVLLDLDHFKQVNDTHGHAAGDQVLKAAADALRSVCRDVDVAARIGGEELALLLPETWTDGAHTVAERVRERIEGEPHRSPAGASFRVTASLGVATLGHEASDGEALLQTADEALYRAKDGGRNQVVLAE